VRKGFIIALALLLITAHSLGCAEQTKPTKEDVLKFAQAISVVETDRDALIVEYQAFAEGFLDMPTLQVFEKAEYFFKTHTDLRKRILNIPTPTLEIKQVHSKFVIAYAAENKAYLAIQSFLVSGDEEGLHTAVNLFSQADTIFVEAYNMMDKLLWQFGLKWSDIQ